MRRLDVEQGSDEWRKARCGSLGASVVHEAVAKTKTGWGASRANRMATLIVERLTGVPQDTYQSAAMLHGIETEPEARAAYEFEYDRDVELVGLVLHPEIDGTHASPDGLVSTNGGLEIKCPQAAAHLDFLLTGTIPDKYVIQMQWSMRCCERDWWDFASYNQVFPPEMRLRVKRVERDDDRIAELDREVRTFLSELDTKMDALLSAYGESCILEQRLRASVG